MPLLQFTPFTSAVSPTFFHALTKHKLDVAMLSDEWIPLTGNYSLGRRIVDRESGQEVGLGCSLGVEEGSFNSSSSSSAPPGTIPMAGLLKNYNTIEEFQKADKTALFNDMLQKISKENTISGLNPFLVLTFADLKKYKYYYWFAFPSVISKPSWEISDNGFEKMSKDSALKWKTAVATTEALKKLPFCLGKLSNDGTPEISDLSTYATFFEGVAEENRLLIFQDPSSLPENPGWPVRNALFYLSTKFAVKNITLVCLRERLEHSMSGMIYHGSGEGYTLGDEVKGTGWEKNEKGKLGPKMVDLGGVMDPARLASQAVDLNLKLMRWRILPSLDLDSISSTSCLLLGSGTLGCYVGRMLMGWGVRNITFVDSGKVSFSNPVRQPLFEFADSLNGGKEKAVAAADAMKRIFPGVNAQGHTLSIPMPGHPVSPQALTETKESVKKLETLVASHDVIFLLMDSRESRWLPTVLGASMHKIVINAALGFDGWLVMRHGAGWKKEDGLEHKRLSCYFCQDSNALGNSLNDRTLDQMCTVSRPGLAPVASATAVELLVALLTHPLRASAPADMPEKEEVTRGSPLGMVPHQLRGSLASFNNLVLNGEAFGMCTACSPKILEEYQSKGFEMLLRAFNEPDYLPKLTGLDQLNKETEGLMEEMEEDWDEED